MGGKKFRFGLQSVLTLRTYEAERARQTLARAAQRRRSQEEHVEALRAVVAERAVVPPAEGRLDPHAMRRLAAFRRDAERAAEAAARQLDALHAQEETARQAMLRRHTAEASIETLRERAHAQHRHAQHAAESAFLDEQALAGYHRARRTEPS